MNIYKLIFTLSILLFMSGCTTAPSSKSPPKPTTKQMIYEACMPSETQRIKEKGKSEPELVAHYVCQIEAGLCEKEPKKDSCQKTLLNYELELNKEGGSLLYKAAYVGDYRLVEAMIKAGANVNYSVISIPHTQFGAGWTPLMIAVAEGNKNVVTVLISSGADVNAKNQLGRTPLMFSAKYGFYSIAESLLESGANTDVIPNDKDGWTAMISAAYEGHDNIVNLLLSNGADQSILDKNGKTALMLAEEQGNIKVVEILKGSR